MTQKKGSVSYFQYLRVASTFGLSMALRIYVLGIWGGGWLDKKFHTSPWLTLLGILVAIFLSFKFLLDHLSQISDKSEE